MTLCRFIQGGEKTAVTPLFFPLLSPANARHSDRREESHYLRGLRVEPAKTETKMKGIAEDPESSSVLNDRSGQKKDPYLLIATLVDKGLSSVLICH